MKNKIDFDTVTGIKWVVTQDQNFAGWSESKLYILHGGDTRLNILTIEKKSCTDHIWSNWIETGIFNKLPYFDWQKGKYNQTAIRNKVKELLADGKLVEMQRNDVNSSSLKYLQIN